MSAHDQQVVQLVENLGAQLAALPDSTPNDRARATLAELRALLGNRGYHFERSPEEKTGRSERLAQRQREVEGSAARGAGRTIKG